MGGIEKSIEIKATPEKIWEMLALDRWTEWQVVGGLGSLQIEKGVTFTSEVNTPEGAALRIRYMLQNPEMMREMGLKAKEFVRENFLITRHLREYLTLIYALLHGEEERIELK